MEQVSCPHCGNTDTRMIEVVQFHRAVTGEITVVYHCEVCSKEWTVKK